MPSFVRRKLLLLVCTVTEADDQIDLAENDYLRALAAALDLPPSAHAVRKGPPRIPAGV